MVSDAQVQELVARVLTEKLGPAGFRSADSVSARDSDGDPIIRVLAHFDRPLQNFEPLFESVDAIRDQLIGQGDDRFVFVTPDVIGADDMDEEDEDIDASTEGTVP